jgi:calpain-7
MCNGFRYGDVLITMGTGKMSVDAEKELGLAAQHDYAVLDLKEDNGQQMVLLKNPWCEATLWKDAPASDDPALENYLPAASSDAKLAPGTFWMSLNDIFQHFESAYLNWNPGMFRHRQDVHFGWDLSVGDQSSISFVDNPQFSLLSKKGGLVWLLLCRHFQDLPAGDDEDGEDAVTEASPGHISLYAFSSHGERVPVNNATGEHSPYVDSPQTLLRLEMAVDSTLTIVVSEQDLPRVKQNFTLIAYSIEAAELSHATVKYTESVSIKSHWAANTAGGSLNSPKFATNPQFRLDVSAPTTIAMLLETSVPNLKVNAKLCHGRGLRVHTLRRQDILLDSHEYRSGSDFSELTAPLDAGSYTIVASTFEQGQIGDFVLRIDAQEPVKLTQVASEDAGKFRQRLPKAIFGPPDKKLLIPIYPIRMLKFSAVVTFASSYYPPQAGSSSDGKPTSAELIIKIRNLLADKKPTAFGGSNRTRCPIRVTMQVDDGPHAQKLASSCDGEFSDDTDAGLRLPEISLSPEMMRGHEIYLMLERLGGGVNGSEERYWVDIIIDGGVGGGVQTSTYGWRRWFD